MTKSNKYLIKLKIIICVLVTVLVACGIKGPPLPPLEEETVQKLKAAEMSGETTSGDATKVRPLLKNK